MTDTDQMSGVETTSSQASARHTVATLVATVSDCDLIAALDRMYFDEAGHEGAYLEMRQKLRGVVAEPSAMDCVLSRRWSLDDPPEPVVDVSGREMGDPERYAIEYEPWPRWLGMAVHVAPELELSDADMLANILYEMSWAGFDEADIAAQKDEIMERKEEVDRLIDEGRIDELAPLVLKPQE